MYLNYWLSHLLLRLGFELPQARAYVRRRAMRSLLEQLEDRIAPATFVVTTTGNSGEGSLRQAIFDANDLDGTDFITFNIPGGGVQTITPNIPLPNITDPVIINAITQPGWTPTTPMIVLDGHLAGNADGLRFTVGGNTVQGLVIHSFEFVGIILAESAGPTSVGGNTIQFNFLGTDATGTVAKPNEVGLQLVSSPNNVIKYNLISGNVQSGIEMDFAESTGNKVQANKIGSDVTGSHALGNGFNGIFIGAPNVPFLREHPESPETYASGNLIGGLDLDLGNPEPLGNLIIGNKHAGVYIFRGADNRVQGNYIGINTQNVAIPNGTDGVAAEFGADGVFIEEGHHNTIGGFAPGAGNVISGNIGAGVRIRAMKRYASDNVIQGNRIGTDGSGHIQEGLGNKTNGVEITNTTEDLSGDVDASNLIGGYDELDGSLDGNVHARNIIAGNGNDGIFIAGHFLENYIQGNYIGVDIDGNFDVADQTSNGRDGIRLTAFAGLDVKSSIAIIGSEDPAQHTAGNIVAGNAGNGVFIGFGAKARVFGNYIGVNESLARIGNGGNGIHISNSSGNIIGGPEPLNGETAYLTNYISANLNDGIQISSGSSENHVVGNHIGFSLTEDPEFGNGRHGIAIISSDNNHIGDGTLRGRNSIIKSVEFGIVIAGLDATLNKVLGNFIGVDLDGSTPQGNQSAGVVLFDASENTIGGNGEERNLISGNHGPGVRIENGKENKVLGNAIGADFSGHTAEGFGNAGNGVVILNSADNTVQGNDLTQNGDEILGTGIEISGTGATGNKVVGNTIYEHPFAGVYLSDGASENHIGGDGPDASNIINTNFHGVGMDGRVHDNHVVNNFIGTNLLGLPAEGFGNEQSGILITSGHDNEIRANKIGGNTDGIFISGEMSHDNNVQGNTIVGNTDRGVAFFDRASHNRVGGLLDEYRNIIAGNGEGVRIDFFSHDNSVMKNVIGTDDTGAFDPEVGNLLWGVVIHEASGNQITDNLIRGNLNGLSISGTEARHNIVDQNKFTHNTINGVQVFDGASENSIGQILGNQISASQFGVVVEGGSFNNGVAHNLIGTNEEGALATGLGNSDQGVVIRDGRLNTVERNTIRGSIKGVTITGGEQNVVRGNTITDNSERAILLTAGTTNNLIGGTTALSGNIITNNGAGIHIEMLSNNNRIIDNRIGTGDMGELDPSLGNTGTGISIVDSHHTTIESNVIRSNTTGISIVGADSRSNSVRDNVITNNSEHGVAILAGASDNSIGGVGTDDFNRISENLKTGVVVGAGVNNSIRRNHIFGNFSLGIDLGDNGPTPNEKVKDTDFGPNNLQNFPQLTLATIGLSRRIVGTLSSTPGVAFTLEFFTTTAPDSSAFGEAERFLTTATVTTNASGIASFDVPLPTGDIGGNFLTATATDPNGNTSEFAKTIRIETDNDGDGISDSMEDGGQNGGDANEDGIPDRQQTNVTSFKTINGEVVTLAAPAGVTLSKVTPTENPSPDDAPALAYDLGFFGYQLSGIAPGGAVTVDLILQTNKTPQTYLRYGPVPGLDTPIWYEWMYNGATGAEINGNRIRLHFIDGDFGDDDLTANGIIVDPGGPAFPLSTTVINTNDSGPGSLRQAILNANFNFGPDTIDFQIGSGVQTIMPLTTLPIITDAVTIDGTTQPGFAGSPIIELSGLFAPGTGLAIAAPNVTVRGLVINHFPGIGIRFGQLNNQTPIDFRIEGNYIGTDVTGMQAIANGYGIDVSAGTGIIGGTSVAARNVISGNVFQGIGLGNSVGVQVKGNYIGVAADGVSPLGNGDDGVASALGAQGVMIGGLEEGAGNIIAFNANAGVETWLADNGISILSNRIFSNGIMGINVTLGAAADLNDDGLQDGTPGNPQNFPVLASAISSAGTTTISGQLQSRPNRTYVVQFFSSDAFLKSGYGEGETFLGSASVTTDASGHADYTTGFNVANAAGRVISATATDTVSGNTSEFSIRLTVNDVLGSVYTVNTTDDVDDGVADATHTSLREAILAANNHPGPDSIRFAIGSGVHTIAPLIPLPAVTDAVVIDGTTQPGFVGTPVIEIVGTSMERNKFNTGTPIRLHLTGLSVFASDSTIRGLAINSFYEFGAEVNPDTWGGRPLQLFGNNNVIVGNFMGTDVTGTIARRTLTETVVAGNGNRIGGTTVQDRNLFAAGQEGGLRVDGTANVIQGNFIGTDITGTKALPNGRGVSFGSVAARLSGANIFGGTAPGAGNLVSGNIADALDIGSGDGSIVQGNLIGTDISGTINLGNSGGGNGIFAHANGNAPLLIGGTDPAARNIISNNSIGMRIFGAGVVVQGNYIGTDITGTIDFGNLNDGMAMNGTEHLIGGTAPGAGNLISGNGRFGILLYNVFGEPVSSGNRIQGNRIGTLLDGVSALGNTSDGVVVAANLGVGTTGTGPFENLIGGLDSGAGNIIGFNGGIGVNILAGERIGILSNSIFSNSSLGIDLNGDGVTPNDSDDPDSGENNLQNFPVLSAAATDGSKTVVSGTLNSTPNAAFIIQIFSSPTVDPSGFGEGQLLLGSHYITTDALGNGAFEFVFPVAIPVSHGITATATDLLNNTSEFSFNLPVPGGTVPSNRPPVAHAGGPYAIDEGDALSLFSPSDDPDGDSISISWDINGDGVFGDATGRAPELTWSQLQALGIVNGPSLFAVRVRVDDGLGHLVTSSATTLNVLNVKPVVDAGPTTRFVDEGTQIDFTGTFTDPGTADTHTLLWHVTADNGQVIADGSAANFSFVPFDNGTYTVTFTVTDSDQESDSVVVTVYVFNANPIVQFTGQPAQGQVDVPINLSSTVSDPSSADEAAGLSYVWFAYLTPDYVVGFTDTTADFSFTPTEPGLWDIFVLVQDKDGGQGSFEVFLDVLPADGEGNHAPVFTSPETFEVPENTNLAGTVVAIDGDLPAQFVVYSITGGADAAKFAIASDGKFVFTSAPDFEDPRDADADNVYQLQVTADDGNGGVTIQQITVIVTPVNDNDPIFTSPATFSVPENTTAVGTMVAHDDDLPPQAVTYSISGGVDAARFLITGSGVLTFATAPDFENPGDTGTNNVYELQVQASDGQGGISTRNITVAVTPVNDNVPVFLSASTFSVSENSNTVGTVVATDADLPGQFVVYLITGGADAALFAVDSGGHLIFTSAPDFEDPQDAGANNVYNVQVTASDGNGGLTSQNITVTVTRVNDNTPVFTSPSAFSVPENSNAVATVVATDADLPAQFVDYSITGGADAGKFAVDSNGNLVFTSAPDFEGPTDVGANNVYNVQVTANDGNGGTTTQNITVTVTPLNDNDPIFTSPATFSTPKNATAVGTMAATDADLPVQLVTFSISGGPDAARFTISSGGVLSFVTAPDSESPVDAGANNVYELQVRASDGNGGTSTRNIMVTVTPVNDNVPIFSSPATFTMPENSNAVGTVVATDADLPAQFVNYSITGGADASRFAVDSNGNLIFTTAPDFETPADTGANNVYNVQVTANDGNGGTTTQNITVTVTPLNDNDPIITSPEAFSVPENSITVGTIVAADADLPVQIVSFSIIGGADAALFVIDGAGGLIFAVAPDFEDPADAGANNVYEVQVQVSDSNGGIVTQDIAVTVTKADNQAPVFTSPATFTVTENSISVGIVVATDADLPEQSVGYTITGGADASRFAVDSGGNLVFTSAPDFEDPQDVGANNVYKVQVTANDGNGGVTTQDITVTVTPVNETGPTITSSAVFSIPENTIDVGTLLAQDDDLPLQSVVFSITGGADAARFVVDINGVLQFASAPDFEVPGDVGADNVYLLQVTADDGQGGVTTHEMTVTVTALNDHNPIFTSAATFNTPENSTAFGTLSATDADMPLQSISFSLTGGLDAAQFVISNEGVLTFAVAPDFEQPADTNGDNIYELQVTAADGLGGLTVQDITVTVTDVNEVLPGPHLDVGSAVTFIKKQPPISVLPQILVSGTSVLVGGSLELSINLIGSKKKLLDQIVIPDHAQLGSSTGPQVVNRQLTLEIQLNGTATNESIQAFLRGITFATKGKGLKTPTRNMQVSVTDSAGASSTVTQTINVRRITPH